MTSTKNQTNSNDQIEQSTKSQAPKTKQIPMTNFKNGEWGAARFGHWSFGFGNCLGFGAWDLWFLCLGFGAWDL